MSEQDPENIPQESIEAEKTVRANMLRNGFILSMFALAATAMIALTSAITDSRIKEQAALQRLMTLNQLVPSDLYDNAFQTDCTLVTNENALGNNTPKQVYRARYQNSPKALVVEAIAPDGYSGSITLLIGIGPKNQVLGSRVLEHKETPGLGDKIDIRVDDWILSFSQKVLESEQDSRWAVKKDGGQFDQFTGATITPRAVVKAVRKAAFYASQNWDDLFNASTNCPAAQP
jgi:electron transport complex protein RnfG